MIQRPLHRSATAVRAALMQLASLSLDAPYRPFPASGGIGRRERCDIRGKRQHIASPHSQYGTGWGD